MAQRAIEYLASGGIWVGTSPGSSIFSPSGDPSWLVWSLMTSLNDFEGGGRENNSRRLDFTIPFSKSS